MTLTVQDDVGQVADANGYCTVEFFKSYHDSRGNLYAGFTDPQIGQAIVRGTDYVDRRFQYKGWRRNDRTVQTTEWPRNDVRDPEGRVITGVPREVKQATAEYAFRALSGDLLPDPTRDASGRTVKSKSEKVGPIDESVVYVEGSAFEMPRYPLADAILRRAGYVVVNNSIVRG